MIKFSYDPTAKAVYVSFSDKKSDHTVEYGDFIIVDHDENDQIIGVEILDVELDE